MNKKMIRHGLMIAAIVIATFVVAALTPANTSAKANTAAVVTNIAKVDFENRTLYADATRIADNEVPLAAMPEETGLNMTWWWILVSVSVATTGVVIYESRK